MDELREKLLPVLKLRTVELLFLLIVVLLL